MRADQISALNKYQIVELLRRLIAAELSDASIPLRTASVPSEIDIPDSGVDGRVSWYGSPNETDYLPSRFCIFQCKVKDVGAAKLKKEVWKKSTGKAGRPPELTEAISDLLDRGGACILVVGSRLSNSMVQARIDAIRQSIGDAGGQPDRLTAIEIYHADVLADWANSHPSIALWVNGALRTVGLSGFQTYDQWAASEAIANIPFIEDDEPRFSLSGSADARETGRAGSYDARLAFAEMAQRVSSFLSESKRAVRIVGPSGYGKTRAAFQLFSPDQTRADRLKSTAVVFANYEDVKDRLGAIALDLAENGAATILVVDDCPSPVHQDLLNKARRDGSRLRIVTIDVEAQTQQSGHNLIVELGPASNQLIERIIAARNSSLATTAVQFIRESPRGSLAWQFLPLRPSMMGFTL